jgi:hypothetical protein
MAAAAAHTIRSLSPADAPGGDAQLLRVTRTAAAAHVPPRSTPGGWRGMLAAEHQNECEPTPALLAQRANGELPPSRQFKLENHLARCLFCRAAEVRERRASRAFSAVLATGLPAARRPQPEPQPTAWEAAPAARAPATSVPAAPVDPPTTAMEPVPPLQKAEPALEPQPEETVVPAAAEPRRGFVVFPTDGAPGTPRKAGASHAPGGLAQAASAYRPFLLTLLVGGLIILAVALALGSGASSQSSAASLPPPAPGSTPPANVGIAATQRPAKPHPAAKPKPQTPPTSTTPATPTSPSGATSTPQTGAGTPGGAQTPAASAPAPAQSNQPAASSPPQSNSGNGSSGSGNGSGSQPVVATQQGGGLPPQTAPVQGITGGTPTTR